MLSAYPHDVPSPAKMFWSHCVPPLHPNGVPTPVAYGAQVRVQYPGTAPPDGVTNSPAVALPTGLAAAPSRPIAFPWGPSAAAACTPLPAPTGFDELAAALRGLAGWLWAHRTSEAVPKMLARRPGETADSGANALVVADASACAAATLIELGLASTVLTHCR